MNQASGHGIKTIVHLAGVLFLIAFAATLLLTVCNAMTKDRIAMLEQQAETEAMQAVLPVAEAFEEIPGNGSEVVKHIFCGTRAGDTVGWCVSVTPKGYGGEINMMVGVSPGGTVAGVKIISMSETPGLGAKASEPSYYEQYFEQTGPISVIKSGDPKDNEVVAISGATITSRAVTDGVNAALEAVEMMGGGQQ